VGVTDQQGDGVEREQREQRESLRTGLDADD
jgi:hypothetical protein